MAEYDEYLDYPDETLERMAKLWSAFARGVFLWNGTFELTIQTAVQTEIM